MLADAAFAGRAVAVGEALWTGADLSEDMTETTRAALAAGAAERRRLGHYLGAMIHFEGEWYWGVDRLNHLEERLSSLGYDREPEAPPLAPYRDIALLEVALNGRRPVVEVWFSFRSPYSWIAFPRLRRLARHYGAVLELRYILPMVMRGLPVPRNKSRYIMFDTRREADRVGLPFGKVVDPVGSAVERAIAVLHHAVPIGLGEAFADRVLRAVWSEGADLTQDRTLYALAAEAGLGEAAVKAALADPSWRAAAEDNRKALLDAGLWGAPTFRVNGAAAIWGQDRLWAVEAELRRAAVP
jgi:2-hydroxychromene-2-carboxylate isomerase